MSNAINGIYMNIELFLKFLDSLNTYNVDYILIGGLALALHDIPRVTEDIDILVREDEANIAKLRDALHSVYKDESIDEITYEDIKAYPVIRYGTPQNYYIDIITRIGEVFAYNDLESDLIQIKNIPVKIATIETLIKLKKGTLRDIDRADVILLEEKLHRKK